MEARLTVESILIFLDYKTKEKKEEKQEKKKKKRWGIGLIEGDFICKNGLLHN